MNFADRMQEAVARCGNAVLVGLDPHADSLPDEFAAARAPAATRAERAKACADFLCQVIELAAGKVPAVKPQFVLGLVLAAFGGFLVSMFKPQPAPAHKPGTQAAAASVTPQLHKSEAKPL